MDQSAFDAFYERSFHRVVAQVYLTCGNLAEAQDCAQEAFIRAWDKGRQLDRDGQPEAWVRTVAHRISISRWRRDRRQTPVGDFGPEPSIADPDAADRVALHRALLQLPVETRRVIVLHHLDDLPVNDIATELGVPVGTVKARLSRGRARLADLLRADPVDTGAVPALTSLMQESSMPIDNFPDPLGPDPLGPNPLGLDRLASPAFGVTRPPAGEIRRRGALRRRHRALAVSAGVVAAAVLTTGVAVGAAGGVWNTAPWQGPEATATPSSAGPPPVAGSPSGRPVTNQPTWDNVPTTEQIWSSEPGDLQQQDQQTGWSTQEAPSRCTVDTAQLGARTVLQRHFGGSVSSGTESVFVMGFDSTEDAVQARDLLTDWYRSCATRLKDNDDAVNSNSTAGTPVELDGLQVPDGTTAFFHTVMWVEPGEQQQAGTGNFENATVTQVGDRVVWMVAPLRDVTESHCVAGTDAPTPQCSVARQVPAVAALQR